MKTHRISAYLVTAILILAGQGTALGQSAFASLKDPNRPPGSEFGIQDPSKQGLNTMDLDLVDPSFSNIVRALDLELELERNRIPAASFTAEAGPLWNDNHAKQMCPKVCTAKGASWTSQWWTTVPSKMSVCQCR